MRKIKFRVWDKKNNKWIDDCDIAINQKGLLFIRYEGQVEFQPMSLTKSSYFESVEFTGLKDKNGKEIYEGDLITSTDNNGVYGKVSWYEPKFGVYPMDFHSSKKCRLVDDMDDNFNGGSVSVKTGNLEWIEIIGNIYENPKLLK